MSKFKAGDIVIVIKTLSDQIRPGERFVVSEQFRTVDGWCHIENDRIASAAPDTHIQLKSEYDAENIK